ncbi:IS3 family transposase [Actinomadura formosensis]|uniref:IS3 family transposase n=1 Tax=Actinomadura formosensis TaxID=60706 RepID=UPI003D8EFDE8
MPVRAPKRTPAQRRPSPPGDAENLWSPLKTELIYWPGTTFATRAEAETAIFRYIDGRYNPCRIQQGWAACRRTSTRRRSYRRQQDQSDPATNPTRPYLRPITRSPAKRGTSRPVRDFRR